ncbi:OpgC domain-containing protein [Bradyrhizobium sp. SSUT77]|uniref:OpgC domain-containing protein n=1 Tax=Bradyrhizobium sp. SSUT77 TaxID=3040603 RepID=UPI00244AB7F6|nr:OpgC domain-containing protein [Bradyrhizobium sp. SSUT77]MDH2348408.1 OpgC domain-containing protein [Bradyrhizobium sp. SSUT77]
MTMTRSRRETVEFEHPFRITSFERILPAGMITDEELMEGMEGLSFPSFRPVATMMMVPAPPPRSSFVEMVAISSIDLSDAREPMRLYPVSGVPVDLDKHRTSLNIDIRRTLPEIERNALRVLHPQPEPELLATPAMPLAGALPEPKGPGRDLRIDACRGIALWCIFLNHVPNNIGSWLTLRNYGFSDSAEVFMFVSGVTCALAYGSAHSRDGWPGVITRTLWRSWDIYAAFLLLTVACAIMVYLSGGGRIADESNTRLLLEHPGAALAHAAILQYRPVNTDVLPIFVVYHLLFAPLLWLLLRVPNATLGASLLLYVLVHVFGWTVPAWPDNVWFFNPLAWQLLVVLGAWCVIAGRGVWPWMTCRIALVLAVLYLTFSLIVALSWCLTTLEDLVPQALANVVYQVDKSDLAPLRLLHFLALAILAVWLVPRDRQLRTPLMRAAIRCGENSLAIYCLGVLLALASQIALVDISNGLAMQIALSLVGILLMIAAATLLNSIRIKPRRQRFTDPSKMSRK